MAMTNEALSIELTQKMVRLNEALAHINEIARVARDAQAIFHDINVRVKRLNTELAAIKLNSCDHVYVSSDPWQQGETGGGSSPLCIKCGRLDAGWFCPENPVGVCEYDFAVDPLGDGCLHCGMPEERK